MSNRGIVILLLGCCACLLDCAGGRGYLRFEALKYPASTSPYLYGRGGDVVQENRGLTTVGKFSAEKTFWGMAYSLVRLSDDADIVEEANQAIQKAGGEGKINLRISADACALAGIPILPVLPFWPACTIAKLEADIVKESK